MTVSAHKIDMYWAFTVTPKLVKTTQLHVFLCSFQWAFWQALLQ